MEDFNHKASIAVVIPVHNRPTIVLETLACVLAQTLLPDRLVVVGDGSKDHTADSAESWLSRHAKAISWEIIRCPKSTAANARNIGLERIKDAEFVAFLDSDDHWPADFLQRCRAALLSRPEAVAAVAERRFNLYLDEPSQPAGGRELVADPIPWLFENGGGISSCSLLRSSVVREVGGWPVDEFSEDTELYCLMSLRGPWASVPGAPVEVQLGNAAMKNEEGNLSRKYPDRETRWGRRMEEIYKMIVERSPSTDARSLRLALARRWYWAGKEHRRAGQRRQARVCFHRAIRWNPRSWKFWKRSFKVLFE